MWVGGGVRGCIGGPLIGMSELHGGFVHGGGRKRVRDKEREIEGEREGGKERRKREREREGGRAQSAAAEQVSRCDCMSQRSYRSPRETQYKFGFISTPCIDLFRVFLWGFRSKEAIDGCLGENVSTLLLNQLSPL